MLDRRAACAIVVLTWFVDGACAQESVMGPIPSATPGLPASEASPTPEAKLGDDPTDSVNWQDRVAAARRRHADWVACVAAREPGCSDSESPPAPDPMDALLNDDTLVNGDIVSTAKGFKIFRGQSSVPHNLADFQ